MRENWWTPNRCTAEERSTYFLRASGGWLWGTAGERRRQDSTVSASTEPVQKQFATRHLESVGDAPWGAPAPQGTEKREEKENTEGQRSREPPSVYGYSKPQYRPRMAQFRTQKAGEQRAFGPHCMAHSTYWRHSSTWSAQGGYVPAWSLPALHVPIAIVTVDTQGLHIQTNRALFLEVPNVEKQQVQSQHHGAYQEDSGPKGNKWLKSSSGASILHPQPCTRGQMLTWLQQWAAVWLSELPLMIRAVQPSSHVTGPLMYQASLMYQLGCYLQGNATSLP